MKNKVLIGLSGGVDSSVAAYLLKEQGYEVIAATLKLWQKDAEIEDARAVAEKLGLEFHAFDFSSEFEENVVKYFVSEYAQGRTPNPCLICNKKIKWELLLQKADELGCDYIATGHYACLDNSCLIQDARENNQKNAHLTSSGQGNDEPRVHLTPSGQENDELRVHLTPSTQGKDQTYALCYVTRAQLARTLMPLGSYTKDEVREIASRLGLPTASKSDSQDICFIPDGDYAKFLKDYVSKSKGNVPALEFGTPNKTRQKDVEIPCPCTTDSNIINESEKLNQHSANEDLANREPCCEEKKLSFKFDTPGNFVNRAGEILGTHKGIVHYTVGQRRGLGISAPRSLYVLEIRPEANEVVLGYEEEVYQSECTCRDANWIVDLDSILSSECSSTKSISDNSFTTKDCTVKNRNTETYTAKNYNAEICIADNHLSSNKTFRAFVKIRYNHVGEDASVEVVDDKNLRVTFDKPVKGIAPGQAAVFYRINESVSSNNLSYQNGELESVNSNNISATHGEMLGGAVII